MTSNRGKPWTAETVAELERLLTEEKLSDLEAGERLGRSLHSVETKRNELGLRINSKPGHSRSRIRAKQRAARAIIRPAIKADPAQELARTKAANVQHVLDVAQMFGRTRESAIAEYRRRCEVTVTPDQATPLPQAQSWFVGSACSSSAGWLE